MSDIVRSADGGDRIDNHHRSSYSRKRGNGRARLEVFGCPIYDGSDDIRLELTIKRCDLPALYVAAMNQRQKTLGKYLCIRAEVAIAVSGCDQHAVTMDDSKEPGATEEITICVRISPLLFPRLYALLKPCSGRERSEKLLLFASALIEVGHGCEYGS